MRAITTNLQNWPRHKDGRLQFFSTEDAYFFANLIYHNEPEIQKLRRAHTRARKDFKTLRNNHRADLDTMGRLATTVQYYRECLEEIDRIHEDKFL